MRDRPPVGCRREVVQRLSPAPLRRTASPRVPLAGARALPDADAAGGRVGRGERRGPGCAGAGRPSATRFAGDGRHGAAGRGAARAGRGGRHDVADGVRRAVRARSRGRGRTTALPCRGSGGRPTSATTPGKLHSVSCAFVVSRCRRTTRKGSGGPRGRPSRGTPARRTTSASATGTVAGRLVTWTADIRGGATGQRVGCVELAPLPASREGLRPADRGAHGRRRRGAMELWEASTSAPPNTSCRRSAIGCASSAAGLGACGGPDWIRPAWASDADREKDAEQAGDSSGDIEQMGSPCDAGAPPQGREVSETRFGNLPETGGAPRTSITMWRTTAKPASSRGKPCVYETRRAPRFSGELG